MGEGAGWWVREPFEGPLLRGLGCIPFPVCPAEFSFCKESPGPWDITTAFQSAPSSYPPENPSALGRGPRWGDVATSVGTTQKRRGCVWMRQVS